MVANGVKVREIVEAKDEEGVVWDPNAQCWTQCEVDEPLEDDQLDPEDLGVSWNSALDVHPTRPGGKARDCASGGKSYQFTPVEMGYLRFPTAIHCHACPH